ncbi:TonB-dependent receptor plug domain-containing protein [Mariniflexile litorale]|uniref:TonB-dependent receptor plug domain-containing protein n=1 Tax=Mariniflexile litorale TaxID=3045158 RepID=A0AAU7EHY9_9FLAO|nr:TonB-dependent receptor plug domain-containing protein [Mariniflexile sp. KMM 9835]MDQ8211268.1 TonB-dependent receptor plug domain-containing protein [Mariniflexile sp. KMM 9835]
MSIFFNDLAKQLLRSLLIGVTTTTLLHAQEKKSIPSIEKIYVHTDRSCYTLGESLWYKAYSVYAYSNLLFNESNLLYVELVSPDSKIIASNKTRLEEGLGHGDFKLTDSTGVKAGIYQLRAYTNFSRNFGTDFVFKKDIEIIDVFENSASNNNESNKPKPVVNNTVENTQNTFKVQFFPEGGSLINEVESTVAFKAVDANEQPIDLKGKIFDSEGALVALFISQHDGMGKFPFKPIKGKQYRAEATTSNGELIEVMLPNIQETGYLLSFKKINEKEVITIKTNQETLLQEPNAPLTLIGTSRGISYFEGTQPLTETTLSFQLPKNDFPEGITQLTLYGANLKPQSERLIFIEKEHDLELNIITDKKTYEPNEKVTVTVSSKTKTGQVVPASFSLSSTDTNGVKDEKDYGINISSYFLMESDIRGQVHNPSYYFDDSNPNRLDHLDLLLLTQGWRDFIWKTMPQENDSIHYNIEKNFTISGRVKQLLGNKPKANSNVTLAIVNKKGFNIFNTVTNSEGGFKFDDLSFFGETNIFLNSRNEKGNNNGEIIMYSTKKNIPLETDFKKTNFIFNKTTNTIKENIYKKYVMNGIAPENMLDEIEIIGKKKEKGTPSLYGNADNTFIIDDKTQHFTDIYQLIQFSLPGVMAIGGNIGFSRFGGRPAYIMIDGVEWDQADLRGISTDDVAKIEAFKGPSTAIFGSRGANGVIIIYTKDGFVNNKPKKKYHSITKTLDGYYDARYFYSPNPEKLNLDFDNKLTVRNTLYWNPYIHPDETGISQATYYNSKVETTVKVSLEGITATGIPVVLKTHYSIKSN